MKIIIDFDGTLTFEEYQAQPLADLSLATLANEIVDVPVEQLTAVYAQTKTQMLQTPHNYWWEVNGLIASYCDEGAFILNTTILQVMLGANKKYRQAVANVYKTNEYDAILKCTNDLFHRHTAELPPAFRTAARDVLVYLDLRQEFEPIILTNSLGNKVRRQLSTLELDTVINVLGDTRQYAMDPQWGHKFSHPTHGDIQIWPVSKYHRVDLRRPDYYHALNSAMADGSQLVVVADTFSMPGALPLLMGIPFFLLRTPYTPAWCVQIVNSHPLGFVLDELAELPIGLESFLDKEFSRYEFK